MNERVVEPKMNGYVTGSQQLDHFKRFVRGFDMNLLLEVVQQTRSAVLWQRSNESGCEHRQNLYVLYISTQWYSGPLDDISSKLQVT